MKIVNFFLLSVLCIIGSAGCTRMINEMLNPIPGPKDKDYVRRANGTLLSNCNGGGFFKDSPKRLENFWKDNNLPYGTLDYRCKDGKPYMPEN